MTIVTYDAASVCVYYIYVAAAGSTKNTHINPTYYNSTTTGTQPLT